jgi:hypothetical protein
MTRARATAAATAALGGCLVLLSSTPAPSLVLAAAPSLSQSLPLPEQEKFFDATRENLARSMRVQNRYAYKERRTELHMNPFGRLGTGGGVTVYEVTPAEDGSATFRRLLERDGEPVTDSEPERRARRARQRSRSAVDDAVAVLRFTIDRREKLDGRDAIVVTFEPRPDGEPTTREGRIAKVMKGTIWVDEASHEVMRAEATAVDDLSYGFGIIARLNEGTHVTFTREPVVDGGIWLPTSVRFQGEGKALLVRRLKIDHVIEWFDYRRIGG